MIGIKRAIRTRKSGFTLLEIMVALALLALSFTALLLVQGRATNLGVEARTLSIATQLARYQLMECKREAQKYIAAASDFKLEGNFSELGFEKFTWECHAPKFNMKQPSASQVEKSIHANTPEQAKKQQDKQVSQSAVAPVMGIVTDTLSNSVRELALIVRWGDSSANDKDSSKDELRVVTHIIDLSAMQALSKMLKQGADQLNKKPSEKTQEQGPPAQPGPGQVPPGQFQPRGSPPMPGPLGPGGPRPGGL